MVKAELSSESDEYYELKRRLNLPWEYPRAEDDVILYPTADDNLKADIAMELLPDGTRPNYWREGPYRGGSFGLCLGGNLEQMRQLIDVTSRVQEIYEGIRDKYHSLPLELLQAESSSNHPLSLAAGVIEFELVSEVKDIDPDRAAQIASSYWSYSHALMYAKELADERYF